MSNAIRTSNLFTRGEPSDGDAEMDLMNEMDRVFFAQVPRFNDSVKKLSFAPQMNGQQTNPSFKSSKWSLG